MDSSTGITRYRTIAGYTVRVDVRQPYTVDGAPRIFEHLAR